MARAGEAPEVVLEATYGWYWAVDALQELGAQVHLAHPLGVKAFEYRRVKNDERDAARSGRSAADGPAARGVDRPAGDPGAAGAGAAPGQAGRAAQQLQGRRSTRCWPSAASRCSMTDLFGVAGTELLDRLQLPEPVRGADRLAAPDDRRAGLRDRRVRRAWSGAGWPAIPGYVAVQTIPGIGPILGAVFVAEIGDVHRFTRAGAADLLGRVDAQAPRVRHPRAPRPDHQAGLPAGPLGRDRVGADPAQDQRGRAGSGTGSADRRGRNIGVVAAARRQLEFVFYALRDHHVRALQGTRPVAA